MCKSLHANKLFDDCRILQRPECSALRCVSTTEIVDMLLGCYQEALGSVEQHPLITLECSSHVQIEMSLVRMFLQANDSHTHIWVARNARHALSLADCVCDSFEDDDTDISAQVEFEHIIFVIKSREMTHIICPQSVLARFVHTLMESANADAIGALIVPHGHQTDVCESSSILNTFVMLERPLVIVTGDTCGVPTEHVAQTFWGQIHLRRNPTATILVCSLCGVFIATVCLH